MLRSQHPIYVIKIGKNADTSEHQSNKAAGDGSITLPPSAQSAPLWRPLCAALIKLQVGMTLSENGMDVRR